jgi:hypothetical protein
MGNSKLLKKVYQMLEECEKEHTFQGTIQELNTSADYAARLVRGLTVETNDGMRTVNFSGFLNSDPVVNTSHLKFADEVIVLGSQHRQRENETVPRLILYPTDQQLLLARTRKSPYWEDWVIVVCYVLSGVLGGLSIFAFGFYNHPFTVLVVVGAAFLYIILGGTLWYSKFSRRDRVLDFNSEEWDEIIETIAARFPNAIEQWFQKLGE